eukprot:SAG11_NODE_14074_length_626_cov_1.045541_1_plen_27_part_10
MLSIFTVYLLRPATPVDWHPTSGRDIT